ncbi:uncharacterized protein LY89DRAFT_711846 [Mollisia scopiformis]|uniref:Uncharacterized protein n=1 Tax=Mollisia scopiformis TaxID=149040 RepID=A0A132B7U6_MOLSC|nr:uncharacterized protein LY89DRAFT_711846 [Mollisia scopiformis]KUJ08059.1 hypothetical protein LY89DRAFT_711846 [Mollisia scopiformis]
MVSLVPVSITSTQAYSQFEPKCTTPNKTVNYVGSPDTRGTFDLLWSCLLTIVACTWSLQYLNVPEQREDLDPGWKRHIKWSVRTMWPKLKWSFITVIAPEVTLGKAFGNQLADRQVRRGWSQLAAEDGVPGSLLHASYANMGGFWLEIVGQPENTIDLQEFYSSPQGQLPRHFLLSGQDIIQLRIKRIIPRLPSISREEIMERDRGSGESFALSTAGGQILWITIQITARRARGLTVSQLEIAVIAFSACAIATYIANWNRPKQILRPVAIRIEIPVSSFDKKVTEIQAALNEARSQRGRSLFDEIIPSALRGNKELADIPDGYAGLGFLYMGIAGAVLFGGIHLAAWNFHFPTNIELIGWRVASLKDFRKHLGAFLIRRRPRV